MEGREKRIDLRLGGFACSLQGFDDPVATLGQILHRMREAQVALPDGRPLFDEDTLRRLEGEIAAAVNGAVTATPGLVLAAGRAGSEVATPPSVPVETASDPDAALTGLRAAVADAGKPEGYPQAATANSAEHEAAPDAVDGAAVQGAEAASTEAAAAEADAEAAEPVPAENADAARSAENLFAEDALPDTGDGPDANLFDETERAGAGDPVTGDDAPGLRTAAADEPVAGIEEPAFEEPAPGDRPEARRPGAARGKPQTAGAADAGADEPPANLFSEAEEDEGDDLNLFSEEDAEREIEPAPDDTAGDPAALPEGEAVGPGSFRDLDRFNPRTTPAPVREEAPAARRVSTVSAGELAEKAGAKTPADLIGAAAAWLTVVKGHGSFTKREVLQVFEGLPGDHPKTAEAKVKGFGRLVRNGEVTPGEDGRFRLSEAERDRYEELLN